MTRTSHTHLANCTDSNKCTDNQRERDGWGKRHHMWVPGPELFGKVAFAMFTCTPVVHSPVEFTFMLSCLQERLISCDWARLLPLMKQWNRIVLVENTNTENIKMSETDSDEITFFKLVSDHNRGLVAQTRGLLYRVWSVLIFLSCKGPFQPQSQELNSGTKSGPKSSFGACMFALPLHLKKAWRLD